MYTETEGIILRQIKTAGGRRMIVVFSRKYGKISAGTGINERGKNKSALALRPFTYGRYELFKSRDSYNINGAETLESFYSFGENVDKYMAASYVLELTDRLLEEDQPSEGLFKLLLDFLRTLEKRPADFDTLVIGFQIRALALSGTAIQSEACIRCGRTDNLKYLSIPEGGLLCGDCFTEADALNPLIFEITDDIINVIRFMGSHPVSSLASLSVGKGTAAQLRRMLRSYYSFHLGVENLKSEGLRI